MLLEVTPNDWTGITEIRMHPPNRVEVGKDKDIDLHMSGEKANIGNARKTYGERIKYISQSLIRTPWGLRRSLYNRNF